jgi:hypothetical protein
MKFAQLLDNVAVYMSGAINRLFELNRDDYPATGVQPYSGDQPSQKHH